MATSKAVKISGALALSGLLAAYGCSSSEEGDAPVSRKQDNATDSNGTGSGSSKGATGVVGLALALGAANVDLVNFVVYRDVDGDGDEDEVESGALQVGANGRVSGTIAGLPAGSGYRLELSAPQAEGLEPCTGEAPFIIVANATKYLSMSLQCDVSEPNGNVSVDGTVNHCPYRIAAVATPGVQVVGGVVTLLAEAEDLDGDSLTFEWFNGANVFATGASASFVCPDVAQFPIGLRVGDGQCTKELTVPILVDCIADDGGPDPDAGAPVLPEVDAGVDSDAGIADPGPDGGEDIDGGGVVMGDGEEKDCGTDEPPVT